MENSSERNSGGCDSTSESESDHQLQDQEQAPRKGKHQWTEEQRLQKRKELNLKRRKRARSNKKARVEAVRAEEEARLAALSEEERQQYEREQAEQKELRVQAHLAQQLKVEAALVDGLRVVVECSALCQQTNKEMRSLTKQLSVCVGVNKLASKPVALTLTSWNAELASCSQGADNWRVVKHDRPALEVFKGEQVVVLSPDAPDALTHLQQDTVYVIGGIVDRTVKKNITLKFAESSGVRVARLPVQEYAQELGLGKGVPKRPVLNVSDVVVALIELNCSGDWLAALNAAIPHRKRRDTSLSYAERRQQQQQQQQQHDASHQSGEQPPPQVATEH